MGQSGEVVEVLPFDQYRVKIDGTERSSLCNRKFLRAITPYSQIAKELTTVLREVETDSMKDYETAQTVVKDSPTSIGRSTSTRRPPDSLEMNMLRDDILLFQ